MADTTAQHAEAMIAVVGAAPLVPMADTRDGMRRLLADGQNVFGPPNRFEMDHFHSPDPDAADRSYAPHSGFVTSFRPHPTLHTELEDGAVPGTEPSAVWLRHTVYGALEGVRRTPGERCFAAFGYTADGSHNLERELVGEGYRRHFAYTVGDSATAWHRQLTRRYPVPGDHGSDGLAHRAGRTAIEGILPEDTELVLVDTACSSSLYALDLAVKALREDAYELAVCGGAFAYGPRSHVLFAKLRGLSRSGEVRAFDAAADGVLFSDGAAALVLKTLARARRDGDRVLATVEGIGLSCDGRGRAIFAPNETGQTLAMRRAYADADLDPARVRWVIGHATGTEAGNRAEIAALAAAAGEGPDALLTSNKAVLGHTGWAAGAVSVVQAVTGLEEGRVPAQTYLREPSPALDGTRFTVPFRDTALGGEGPHRVAVSAFGFGGTNAHLVLSAADPSAPETRPRRYADPGRPVVVGWSAWLPGHTGTDGRERTARWLLGDSTAAPLPTFATPYPAPDFRSVRLPPLVVAATDPSQLMLLQAADRLDSRVQRAAAALRDRTGAIVGHYGPTTFGVNHALRCHLEELRRELLNGDPDDTVGTGSTVRSGTAFEAVAARIRAQLPPSDDAALPGMMPNIIAARLTSHSDYRGLNATVDTGPDSALDALRCAERYLRHGNLDMALVAGVSADTSAETARALGTTTGGRSPAEGAFVVVLSTADAARQHGLTPLGRLATKWGPSIPENRPEHCAALADTGRSYPGADPLIALLCAVLGTDGKAAPQAISSFLDRGPRAEFAPGPGR
ncbi:beta-ketoacyl synthase N-terminal-like domain-containing protein [Streptomyces griseus]|uniref:beta-ketoacyl synthase N-terminal-like domain-containing protein n=1 Tax=Streptomyces griseus TaxID=1911 RepID=UPI0004C6BAFF|nr:beta-ketoacyl synthase N-terminal-like domain-containing protein [Streptomyces griseus]